MHLGRLFVVSFDLRCESINVYIISRYDEHLKDAKTVGLKKGATAGLGIGVNSFFLFFVHAVGFWFGAYLIQYQGATLGDVLIVRYYVSFDDVPMIFVEILDIFISVKTIVDNHYLEKF